MKATRALLAIFLGIVMSCADAYELATHALITYSAFGQSKLISGSVIQNLGIDSLLSSPDTNTQPFGNTYYDVQGSTISARTNKPFEDAIIDGGGAPGFGVPALTLPGWLMRGAIREDDLGTTLGFNNGDDPHDDPYGSIQRVYNHFFDPIGNRPLTVLGIPAGEPNPNWAIGTSNAFTTPIAENASRRNHFTVYDAREAMYRALTGKTKDGTDASTSGDTAAQKEAMRKTYWATLFRSLGDILHLNQDMAQPQHTRNEAHSGLGGALSNGVTGHSSFYELYVDARAQGATEFFMKDEAVKVVALTPLAFDGYGIPAFNKFSDFWSSGTGSTSLTGAGLADYSNHNFFTAAKNFGDTEFQNPPSDLSKYTPALSPYLLADGTQVARKYLVGKGNLPAIRMSQQGIWGSDPSPVASIAYTLDRNVYDDMVGLLLPRAAAYSAGILNYFFRGQMEISLPAAGVFALVDHAKFAPGGANYPTNAATGFKGFDKIKLKLKNTTPAITPPGGSSVEQAMPDGKIVAVVKFHRDTCYTDDLDNEPTTAAAGPACRDSKEEIVVSDAATDANGLAVRALPSGSADPVELTFNFSDKQIPINAWDVYLQVVYRGKLGGEDDAVVVATKDISEPTYVVFSSPFWWDSNTHTASLLNVAPPVNPNYFSEFKLLVGPPQVPVATIEPPAEASHRLLAPYFSRFAALQDLAQRMQFTVTCNCFDTADREVAAYVAQKGNDYQPLFRFAGVGSWADFLPYTGVVDQVMWRELINDAGKPKLPTLSDGPGATDKLKPVAQRDLGAAPTTADKLRLPVLPDWARYPLPVEISGW